MNAAETEPNEFAIRSILRLAVKGIGNHIPHRGLHQLSFGGRAGWTSSLNANVHIGAERVAADGVHSSG